MRYSTNLFLASTAYYYYYILLAHSTTTLTKVIHGRQQNPTNMVKITSATNHCLIVPKDAHTNIGDSEHPGGMTTYCTSQGRSSPEQGLLPDNFWSQVAYTTGTGVKGGKYVQLTGCIRPETVDRLNPGDAGGQYDSNGGPGGRGNPEGSTCAGYSSYVELIEPAGPRACIRCCQDPTDCPLDKDTQGCPNVIPGNYFNCA
ncbi:hypothetical protein AMATHDRAFT_63159 [Amanita thiersii Skay4041]|uniref:Uncharacterized protein n=1 Tax=Amanita thiersii Skay4041 TaxID=703135 RepID=A0A2A9NFS0_9AGAR|nr:hypothetical protein AMATHDRAFT_63159 [Amanita thiersii Skay4041]